MILKKAGQILWYPSLQPTNSNSDKKATFSSIKLGKKTRLFYKDITPDEGEYVSEYEIEFE